MAAVAQLTAHTTSIKTSAPVLSIVAALLAVLTCMIALAAQPAGNAQQVISAPAAMTEPLRDSSVPAARSDSNVLPDEQAPTF